MRCEELILSGSREVCEELILTVGAGRYVRSSYSQWERGGM